MKKSTTIALKIATITFLTLSMSIVLFPIPRNPIVREVQFIRNIGQLEITQSHGAAGQWDYLFEENTGQTYGGQLSTGTLTTTVTLPQTTTQPQTTTTSSLLNAMQQNFNQVVTATGGTYQ